MSCPTCHGHGIYDPGDPEHGPAIYFCHCPAGEEAWLEHNRLEICTGCGAEAFVCIVANADIRDNYEGPYALCKAAYEEWLVIGDEVTLVHD